jgi:hypothetical protein
LIDESASNKKITNIVEIFEDGGDDKDSTPDQVKENDCTVNDVYTRDGVTQDPPCDEDDHDIAELTVKMVINEVCNGIDDNLDGNIDEGFEDKAAGKTCDDQDAGTKDDVYNNVCVCVGTPLVCADAGYDGADAVGKLCDDQDAGTKDDAYNQNCKCM